MKNDVIILAMHGAPPKDFPRQEAVELFSLHARLEHAHGSDRSALEQRYHELEAKMRSWPRTPENDPFYAGSAALASQLSQETGYPVVLGFNEFCAPSIDEAFGQAMGPGTQRVFVVTAMMTRGGEHSEVEIPQAIQRARKRHPDIEIRYVWPFDVQQIAKFLASQIANFALSGSTSADTADHRR